MEDINPFIAEQRIELYSHTIRESLGNPDILGINGLTTINSNRLVDRANKVSIFMTPEIRVIYMHLSRPSHMLLRYIEGILRYNQDFIKINVNKFKGESGLKSSSIYNAIEELCRYGFITKHYKLTYYWINPFRFVNGNRIKMYPNNLVIKDS